MTTLEHSRMLATVEGRSVVVGAKPSNMWQIPARSVPK